MIGINKLHILPRGIFILLIKLSENVNIFCCFPPRRKHRKDWFKFRVNHNFFFFFCRMWGCSYCELSHDDVSFVGDKTQGYSELFSKCMVLAVLWNVQTFSSWEMLIIMLSLKTIVHSSRWFWVSLVTTCEVVVFLWWPLRSLTAVFKNQAPDDAYFTVCCS